MRLLIVTQYFPPEMGAPQARLSELARRLRDMGHEITVLTALPNYPTGRVFDGYRRKLRVTESIDGMKVVRTWLVPSISSRFLPRLFSYISFAVSSAVLGIWGLGRQDVVLIESPPLFLVPSGIVISRLTRGKPVMMVSDIWPDIAIRMGLLGAGLTTKAMSWLERLSYKHSYAVALTNPGACEQIRQRFPQLPRVTVISNGVDTSMFRPDLRSEEIRRQFGAADGDFLVGYCGLHGLFQGLETVIKAAAKMQDRPEIKFVMVGDGPVKQALIEQAHQMKLSNLRFFDCRPKSEMPGILASLDVSLVPLFGRFPGTMPSKVYEALASGTPPIVAKGCEADPLVTRFDAGLSYEPGDPNELAAAVVKLATDQELRTRMTENCIRLGKRFDRDTIAKQTAEILTAIAEGRPLPEVSWQDSIVAENACNGQRHSS